ncbi:hypothetical protein EJB05_33641, partial [Eragrostis curvula]
AGPAARHGVVRSVDVGSQTVRVSWLETTTECGGGVESDETVSLYDLALLDYDDQVFYGDVVVRLQPMETAIAPNDLTWVGYVIDLCDDGCVKWGNGTTSMVLPHEISVVDEQSISEMEEEMGDWMANDAIKEAWKDKEEVLGVAAAVFPYEISVVEEQTIKEVEEGMDDWVAIDAIKDTQEDTDENLAASALANINRGNGDDGADVSGGEASTPVVSGVTQGLMRLAAEVKAKGKWLLVQSWPRGNAKVGTSSSNGERRLTT